MKRMIKPVETPRIQELYAVCAGCGRFVMERDGGRVFIFGWEDGMGDKPARWQVVVTHSHPACLKWAMDDGLPRELVFGQQIMMVGNGSGS